MAKSMNSGDDGDDPGLRRKSLRLARGNPERAEELQQQVAVRVWEATRDRPDEIRSLPAFRHGVLVNVHRETAREDRRHRHADIHSPAVAAQGVLGRPLSNALPEDPSQLAERGELFRLVRRAITKLTDTSRMVVRMRYFDDLQQRQIARQLNTNEVNVSRILKRAREKLRGLLG